MIAFFAVVSVASQLILFNPSPFFFSRFRFFDFLRLFPFLSAVPLQVRLTDFSRPNVISSELSSSVLVLLSGGGPESFKLTSHLFGEPHCHTPTDCPPSGISLRLANLQHHLSKTFELVSLDFFFLPREIAEDLSYKILGCDVKHETVVYWPLPGSETNLPRSPLLISIARSFCPI